ncbi:MAG: Tim44 domain-containing protein [Alphaproteobacteria bacterium]|nr:Tim44 domain-containing protein [Alphaproteobacteria bacterium]MCB9927943.1 Tim44 domain-containing protein [Alphaproteobacteria bacterium]
MDAGSAFLEILFFGMVAAFLVIRLRSVLGRRMGHERDPQAKGDRSGPTERAKGKAAADDNVIAMPGPRNLPSDPLERGLAEIRRADRSFDPDAFATGARTAFELIVSAFANGDRDTLRSLTSSGVYTTLDSEMTRRERAGETLEATLVRIREAKIVEAQLDGSMAQVTLRIESEQIKVVRNGEGHAIQGQHGTIESVTDVWAFGRDVRSGDPNWTLVEIQDVPADA